MRARALHTNDVALPGTGDSDSDRKMCVKRTEEKNEKLESLLGASRRAENAVLTSDVTGAFVWRECQSNMAKIAAQSSVRDLCH